MEEWKQYSFDILLLACCKLTLVFIFCPLVKLYNRSNQPCVAAELMVYYSKYISIGKFIPPCKSTFIYLRNKRIEITIFYSHRLKELIHNLLQLSKKLDMFISWSLVTSIGLISRQLGTEAGYWYRGTLYKFKT